MYVVQMWDPTSEFHKRYRNGDVVEEPEGELTWVEDPLHAKIYTEPYSWMKPFIAQGYYRWVGLLEARADYLVAQTRAQVGGTHKRGTHRS
jgi:hypothetical protein